MFPWSQAKPPPPSSAGETTGGALPEHDDAVQQRTLAQLAVALQAIPQHEKLEYLQALRVAPSLVETESGPLAYLRFCNGDAVAAALMITVYWRKRKEVFGEARTFLPLLNDDLSGHSALGSDELEIIQRGGFCLLPNDTQGRAVFCNDRSGIPPKFHGRKDVKLRACFRVFQQLARNPNSQATGSVFVVKGLETRENDTIAWEASALLHEAFPVRVHACHVAYVRQQRSGILPFFFPFLLRTIGRFFNTNVIVHDCGSVDELVEEFAKHGISRESMPRSLGGVAGMKGSDPLIPGGTHQTPSDPLNPPAKPFIEQIAGLVEILDRTDGLGLEGSPFEPRPIRSPQVEASHFEVPVAGNGGELLDTNSLGLPPARLPVQQTGFFASAVGSDAAIFGGSGKPSLGSNSSLFGALSLQLLPQHEQVADPVATAPSFPLLGPISATGDSFQGTSKTAVTEECQLDSTPIRQLTHNKHDVPTTATPFASATEKDADPVVMNQPHLFTHEILDKTAFGFEGSPFEPRPIRSPQLDGTRVSTHDADLKLPADRKSVILGSVALPPPQHHRAQSHDCCLLPATGNRSLGIPSPQRQRVASYDSAQVAPGIADAVLGANDPSVEGPGTLAEPDRKMAPRVQAAVSGGSSDHNLAQWEKDRQLLESQCNSYDRRLPTYQKHPPQQTGEEGTAREPVREKGPPKSIGGSSSAPQDIIGAAMQLVSGAENRAFLEAMEKAPNLVQKESNPVRFLRSENFDELAAAHRLAAYWRIRLGVFGERAFLPMNQTTDGALGRKNVNVLQSGFLSQLPNDSAGRSVIFCDGSRLEKSSPSSLRRIFFYMWSVVSENDLSQEDGFVVLYNIVDPNFDRSCEESLCQAMEAHPSRLKRFHLLGFFSDSTGVESHSQGGPDTAIMRSLLCRFDQQEKVIVHVCGTRDDFASELACHELLIDRLPMAFGGRWGVNDFVQWQELRVRHEWALPTPFNARKDAERYLIPILPFSTTPASLSPAENAERQRRLDVVHSRRKRGHAKIKVKALQEQCSSLTRERMELMQEGRALEKLIRIAKAVVEKHIADGSR